MGQNSWCHGELVRELPRGSTAGISFLRSFWLTKALLRIRVAVFLVYKHNSLMQLNLMVHFISMLL